MEKVVPKEYVYILDIPYYPADAPRNVPKNPLVIQVLALPAPNQAPTTLY